MTFNSAHIRLRFGTMKPPRAYAHGLLRRRIKKSGTILSRGGFSLIELLVVILILGILAAIVWVYVRRGNESTYMHRSKADLVSIYQSLEQYHEDYGVYPQDTNRDVPPGLEKYLAPGIWPDAAWPGSVFDWDNWAPGALSYDPKEQVYQISIRFCPIGGPLSACRFPDESWAVNFDVQSAVYFCVQGPCRAHSAKPITHPGYCINC